jgi:GMP synthase (glutamine-hydrolysing)
MRDKRRGHQRRWHGAADVCRFDMSFLSRLSNRIVNEARDINRVTDDITRNPPGSIEWE